MILNLAWEKNWMKACKKGISIHAISYGFIKNYLQNNQHNIPEKYEQGTLPLNPIKEIKK